MDVARLGVRLARRAIDEGGRTDDCAVAFAISEEVNSSDRQRETVDLLARVFAGGAAGPDPARDADADPRPETFETVELLLETGLPVWLSFRRCRHGVCGVFGQHWGPPEGDLFGRAARRFEEMGVGALLINCLPVDHVPGMIPWLRDFTELPLGVYPNLGHSPAVAWRFDEKIGPAEYAELALEWREEGAQIIGGCCGTTPEHIAAVAARARRHEAGSQAAAARRAARERRAAGCGSPSSRGSTTQGASSTRCPSRAGRRPGRIRADARQLPRLEDALQRRAAARASAASTSAAAAASSPSSSR